MTDSIRYVTEHTGTTTIYGNHITPVPSPTAAEEEKPVTAYHDRLVAGEYAGDGPEHDASAADDQGNGPTLAELRAQADERGLPNYGSKAMLSERIAAHDAEPDEPEAEDEDEA